MIWLDTKTQGEADQRRSRMWGTSWTQTDDGGLTGRVIGEGLYEGDQFWADAIKDAYSDPARRLAMAKRSLPLPAAFREAAVALRAIIRGKKKAGEDFDHELRELHWWAAIQSIAWYDQLDITPFALIAGIDLDPQTLGWDELSILNKTDRKLMAERWPSPQRHTTGVILYPEIDREARRLLALHREADLARSMAQIDAMFADEVPLAKRNWVPSALPVRPPMRPVEKRSGFFGKLFRFGSK